MCVRVTWYGEISLIVLTQLRMRTSQGAGCDAYRCKGGGRLPRQLGQKSLFKGCQRLHAVAKSSPSSIMPCWTIDATHWCMQGVNHAMEEQGHAPNCYCSNSSGVSSTSCLPGVWGQPLLPLLLDHLPALLLGLLMQGMAQRECWQHGSAAWQNPSAAAAGRHPCMCLHSVARTC